MPCDFLPQDFMLKRLLLKGVKDGFKEDNRMQLRY